MTEQQKMASANNEEDQPFYTDQGISEITDQGRLSVEDIVTPSIPSEPLKQPDIGRDAKEYPINPVCRGKVIILNHSRYEKEIHERVGTEVDVKSLRETFQKLNFKVHVEDNLSKEGITDHLKKEREGGLKDFDCLILMALTHGSGKDLLHASDQSYPAETLWQDFVGTMVGKPKIFIIQACRDCRLEYIADGPSKESGEIYKVPNEADILISYFPYRDHDTFHSTTEGSKYIQELCHQFNSNTEGENILSLLMQVGRRVGITHMYDDKKQMPVIQSTLLRLLILTRKDPDSTDWYNVLPDDIPEVKKPDDNSIFYLGKLLHEFLTNENERPDPNIEEEAKMILYWISEWPNLFDEERYQAFESIDLFISENELFGKAVSRTLRYLLENYKKEDDRTLPLLCSEENSSEA